MVIGLKLGKIATRFFIKESDGIGNQPFNSESRLCGYYCYSLPALKFAAPTRIS